MNSLHFGKLIGKPFFYTVGSIHEEARTDTTGSKSHIIALSEITPNREKPSQQLLFSIYGKVNSDDTLELNFIPPMLLPPNRSFTQRNFIHFKTNPLHERTTNFRTRFRNHITNGQVYSATPSPQDEKIPTIVPNPNTPNNEDVILRNPFIRELVSDSFQIAQQAKKVVLRQGGFSIANPIPTQYTDTYPQ